MDLKSLQVNAEEYVRNYFLSHNDEKLIFHNMQHTHDVVRAAMQMGDHYHLSESDYTILIVAAWFHDLGYFTAPDSHEEASAELAMSFLDRNEVQEEAFRNQVRDCILATKMPQSPHGLLQEILCDADLFHLGTEKFSEKSNALRKEKEACTGIKINKADWRTGNVGFIAAHRYFTDYARLLLDDEKALHRDALIQKVKESAEEEDKGKKEKKKQEKEMKKTVTAMAEDNEKPAKKDKSKPEKGIETMFRITSNNNQRLSDMADNKAHIMITVNSIMISAIISLLLKQLDHNPHLAIPTFITLGVCVCAIIFSILATRPSIPSGQFSQADIDEKKVNLLFFGNFYKMRLDQYAEGMWKVMDDKEFLYGSLIRDVYSQGVVLGRKYKLLRISYNIFMFGVIIAVLAFIIATVFWVE